MKMAKASQADIEIAIELATALEALSGRWGASMPQKIATPRPDRETEEAFDIDDRDHCRRVCEYLINLGRSASLFRVVMGMATVLDPRNELLDPDADTLQAHPKIQAALSAIDPLPDTYNEACGAIQAEAEALVQRALAAGIVLTIETQPLAPLAMGHYVMRPEVRPARGRAE